MQMQLILPSRMHAVCSKIIKVQKCYNDRKGCLILKQRPGFYFSSNRRYVQSFKEIVEFLSQNVPDFIRFGIEWPYGQFSIPCHNVLRLSVSNI